MRKENRYDYSDAYYDYHSAEPDTCPLCGWPVSRDFTNDNANKPEGEKTVAIVTCLNQGCSFGLVQVKQNGFSEIDFHFLSDLSIHCY